MKTIGLLGGMSWESTVPYYRVLNETVRELLGGHHSARILMYSVDFHEIKELQCAGLWEEAGALLADAAARLEQAGADFLVIATNTMHIVADQIARSIRIPILHVADPTAAAVREAGATTVGLLATGFTMEKEFYRDALAARGLRVLIPDAPDRAEVHRVIYEELVLGKLEDSSRETYRRVIADLVARGAEGIILGCTEIGLLIGQADSPVPVFDTAAIHARAAGRVAVGGA